MCRGLHTRKWATASVVPVAVWRHVERTWLREPEREINHIPEISMCIRNIHNYSKKKRLIEVWIKGNTISEDMLTQYMHLIISRINRPRVILTLFPKRYDIFKTKLYLNLICRNKMPTRCNRWFLLQILLLAQHVSGTIMPIIRSSSVLYKWLLFVVFCALVFKLSVWCGAEGYVSGLRAAALMMGIVVPDTCWASNKICNKNHLLHLVGILFPHINDDARSKPHQIYMNLQIQFIPHKEHSPSTWKGQPVNVVPNSRCLGDTYK